jgi:hypothetical protein
MRVTGRVALTPTLLTQGETARARVSGLPRPDHTAVYFSMFLRKMEQVLDERDRLGSKRGH